jgi:hypothetical protein
VAIEHIDTNLALVAFVDLHEITERLRSRIAPVLEKKFDHGTVITERFAGAVDFRRPRVREKDGQAFIHPIRHTSKKALENQMKVVGLRFAQGKPPFLTTTGFCFASGRWRSLHCRAGGFDLVIAL